MMMMDDDFNECGPHKDEEYTTRTKLEVHLVDHPIL